MKAKDRRWLVLGEDGRHVWLGRHSDPSDDDIHAAKEGLSAQSLGGWLAVSDGDYWDLFCDFVLLPVRPLSNPTEDFEVAKTKFLDRRRKSQLSE